MPLARTCPKCGGPVISTTIAPEKPDYWARGSPGEGWTLTSTPPMKGEVASTVAFRCANCRKNFRIVLAHR